MLYTVEGTCGGKARNNTIKLSKSYLKFIKIRFNYNNTGPLYI